MFSNKRRKFSRIKFGLIFDSKENNGWIFFLFYEICRRFRNSQENVAFLKIGSNCEEKLIFVFKGDWFIFDARKLFNDSSSISCRISNEAVPLQKIGLSKILGPNFTTWRWKSKEVSKVFGRSGCFGESESLSSFFLSTQLSPINRRAF